MYSIRNNVFSISVRNLVEYVFSTGDIDNRQGGTDELKLMLEGARIHRKIQKSMGSSYHAEVPLKVIIDMKTDEVQPCMPDSEMIEYKLSIEGRADGIIADFDEDENGDRTPLGEVVIDEIKTVRKDVDKMKEPVYVHKAQAKVYCYIYAMQHNIDEISCQITYCNPETEVIKRFKEKLTKEELTEWFDLLVDNFKKWSDFVFVEREKFTKSVSGLSFPFEYRDGQKKLVLSVYKSILEEKNLFIQAPTGVGKTISTVYPSVQAMGKGLADKLFYLTSKTITRTVAEETFDILRREGLSFRTVTLTAKDKICMMPERDCNPVACKCAGGHFDRVNEAVYDCITQELVINRDVVMKYAEKHNVCPFEMSLDISTWCDGIICDYNYAFDPDASLKRYFKEGGNGEYIFLVDEAHNLVERGREMFSATLVKEDFLVAKKLVKDKDKKLYNALEKCNKQLLEYKRVCDEYKVLTSISSFIMSLERAFLLMQKYMEEYKGKQEAKELMDFFFEVRHFLNMGELLDEKYVIYTEHDSEKRFMIHLYCVDPSGNISERLKQCRSAVFFSATFLPINYFKEMLSGDTEEYAVYAHSPFDTKNRRIIVAKDVTSRYTRRNTLEYRKICAYIKSMADGKKGRYMVFFPSYSYMKAVYDIFTQLNPCNEISLENVDFTSENGIKALFSDGLNVIMQSSHMREKDKENFLDIFELCDGTLIGFCVVGGIFSEGIDLKDDSLIGAAIVGTGLPMICRERDILRDYFDLCGRDGYSYAYVYPGMNKVLQASGRVIRTASDRGIILLLDDRFLTKEYEMLFPREWDELFPTFLDGVDDCIKEFWGK
ncbi:MAG: ATP-dependent DNA helicase [Lachnospira sp.]